MKPLAPDFRQELLENLTFGYSALVIWKLQKSGLSIGETDEIYRELSREAADQISTERQRSRVEQVFICLLFQLTMVMLSACSFLLLDWLAPIHAAGSCFVGGGQPVSCVLVSLLQYLLWGFMLLTLFMAVYTFKEYPGVTSAMKGRKL